MPKIEQATPEQAQKIAEIKAIRREATKILERGGKVPQDMVDRSNQLTREVLNE